MYSGKIKCIKGYYFTEGKIYNVNNGLLVDDKGNKFEKFVSLGEINANLLSKFEEVKDDKIKLLLKDYEILHNNRTYVVRKSNEYNQIMILKDRYLEYEIRWGERYYTTFKNVKPILDVLNIEIVQEPVKYVIDSDTEYTEEQAIELEKLGLKFKRKEEQ